MDYGIFVACGVQVIRTFKLDVYVHLFVYKTDTLIPKNLLGLYLWFFVTFVTERVQEKKGEACLLLRCIRPLLRNVWLQASPFFERANW